MVIMALFLSPTFATSFNKKTMRKSMITLNRKWIRLIGIVGCTMCLASCKQASDASGMKPSYATMKVEATDKELSTSYSATIRGRQDIDIYPQVSGTLAGRGPGDKRTQQPLLYGSEESQRRGGGGIALPCRGIGQPQLAATADNGQ